MKPLNLNTTGCDPISSNCVIWQGPDIPCIKLCKGDTVSDVVFKLATELCEVLDTLDVSTYDLPSACFNNQACNPSDFHALIQLIIYKICCLESGDTASCDNAAGTTRVSSSTERVISDSTGTCPDCYVTIAKCFQYTNEFGDLVESMKLDDYARAIGNKVCDLVNQITNITYTVNDLDLRVAALESAPAPIVTLPTVTPVCVISPAVPIDMNIVLSALEQQFCSLVSVTGSPNNLSNAIAKQCIGLNGSQALGPYGGTMAALSGWITTANTLAASMNNMWLTICDLRAAVQNIKDTCCPSGCDGVEIKLTAVLSGTELRIFLNGTLPVGFTDCVPTGNIFKITDGYGASVSTPISVLSYINDPVGFPLNIGITPLNILTNLTITSDVCVTDGTNTCQSCITYVVTNISTCPSVTIIPDVITGTSVTVLYTPLYVPGNYTTEVWSSDFTTLVASLTQYLTSATPVTQVIPGLTPGTNYQLRLVIDAAGNVSECPYSTFATNPALCLPPSAVAASVQIPVDCPMCGPALEFSDNPTVDGTYVDVTSDYLLQYSGGSFGNLIQLANDVAVDGTVRQPISFGGRTWIVGSDTQILVYSNAAVTPTLDTTITPGVNGIVNMVYDTDLDLVFFLYNDTITGFRRVGTIDPSAYTVTLNVGPSFSGGGYQAQELYFNPVTFEKYIRVSDGDMYVLSTGATGLTLKATLTAAGSAALRYVVFDPVSGNGWIATSDSTNTEEILVVNGTTYATITTLNTSVASIQPYVGNTYTNAMAFYSNDANSTVYVIYRSIAANYNYYIIAYNASTYVETIFLNEGVSDGSPQPRQIFYSTVFEKVTYGRGSNIDMFDPSGSATDYTPTLTIPNTALKIHEDVVNSLIVITTNIASPTNNLKWYIVDPANAAQCTEGIVDLYLGNEGPYMFNSNTLSWDALATVSASYSTPIAGQFTVTAVFGSASVVTAALLVSTDYGFTYSPLADTSGNLYANVATWSTGRVFANPGLIWQMKVVFTTTDNCSLQSSLI
jgi:hypothetical protein